MHRTVVHVVCPNLRAHPLRHVALRLRRNHAILFRQQKPRWLRFPRRHRSLLLNAFHRDRPLHRFQNRGLVRRSLVSDCVGKTAFGHPDQPMRIRLEMRRLRMRLGAIKNIGNRLTLSGRQRRHVHQRLYPVILWASDHSARIGVSRQQHRPTRFSQSRVRERLCLRVSDVSGIGAHVTLRPSFRNGRMIFCQQEPSAHAPWTNTIVAF